MTVSKAVATSILALVAATMLSGCFVDQKLYEAKSAQLEDANQQIIRLKSDLAAERGRTMDASAQAAGARADAQKALSAEQGKQLQTQRKLDAVAQELKAAQADKAQAVAMADRRVAAAQAEGAKAAADLAKAQQALAAAQAKTRAAESKAMISQARAAQLTAEVAQLKKRVSELEKQLAGAKSPPPTTRPGNGAIIEEH